MASRKTEVIVTCNSKQAQQMLQAMRNELARLTTEYEKLVNAGQGETAEARKLKKEISELSPAIKQTEINMNKVGRVMNDLAGSTLSQLKSALREVKKQMNTVSESNGKLPELRRQYKALTDQIKKLEGGVVNVNRVVGTLKSAPLAELKKAAAQLEREMESLNRDTQAFADKRKQLSMLRKEINSVGKAANGTHGAFMRAAKAVGSYMGVTMVMGKVAEMFRKVIDLNLKFSDQLADIRKVSGLAMEDINRLSTRLATVDTRTTIEELNSIAYAGAKLGIGKYGVEGLEGFVRASNQVNMALKEDLGDDALTALSKITEVMGLIPKMGVEKSMLATGSAMFQLSATSTATANNIVEFAKRLTGMAKVSGITTDQLLALGSAADSMYLMPEVASTAFNKFISSLQTNHNLIEKALKIEPGTISRLYESGNIVDAMVLVFEKMKEQGNMNALKPLFKDLGSDGARLVNVMVTMSQNVDMLRDHLDISADAFREATAVTNEYNIQQETAKALMERASNVWEKAFVNPEGVDNVKELAKSWYDLSVSLTSSAAFMGPAKLALWVILTLVKALIAILPTLMLALTFRGVMALWVHFGSILSGVKTVFSALAAAVMGAIAPQSSYAAATAATAAATEAQAVASEHAAAAQTKVNAAQKLNVYAALAAVILSVVAAIYSYCKASNQAAESQKRVADYMAEAETAYRKQSDRLKSYVSVLTNANTTTEQRGKLIRQFNREYKVYIDKLGIEIKTVDDLKRSYSLLNDEIRKKTFLELKTKGIEDVLNGEGPDGQPSLNKQLSDATLALGDLLRKTPRFSAYDTRWVADALASGKSAKEVAASMMGRTVPSVKDKAMARPVEKVGGDTARLPVETSIDNAQAAQLESLIGRMNGVMNRINYERKRFDDAFDPIIGDWLDYDIMQPDDLGSLDRAAPDKDAIKAAKEAELQAKQERRNQLKEAQDEAKAVIDNIKNFYQRQITQLLKTANEQQWDEALVQSATDYLTARQNLALSNARKGIVGIKTEWDAFKKTMVEDMIEADDEVGYNESKTLLNAINGNNLNALHKKIAALSTALDLPLNAALDAIWKNASLNEKSNETATMRHLRERQKILLTDNYTSQVDSQYSSSMTKLGYFDLDEQQSKTLSVGGVPAESLLKNRAKDIDRVFKNARDNFADLLAIGDVTSEAGRNNLLMLLFGNNVFALPRTPLHGMINAAGTDLQLFYEELIKYVDDYTEAVKKAEERTKKLIDFKWNRSSQKKAVDSTNRKMELYRDGMLQHSTVADDSLPAYGVYGNMSFASEFGVDPEIEAYKAKIAAAKAYYDFMESHGATASMLHEQELKIAEAQWELTQGLAANIKSQMDWLFSLTQPVQDFGSKVGEAFAMMSSDADAGRKALKAAVGEMINDMLRQTGEIVKDYVKRRIMQKAHDRLTSLEASKHQGEMTNIQNQGDSARQTLHETIQTGLVDIDRKAAAETTNIQTQSTAESVQTDAKEAQASTSLNIAKGAGEIIGKLGWWGIPLVAVITALLNGLLSFAMSKVSNLFGGSASSDTSAVQTKLVSGMLTYDAGNVQSFRGVRDGKTYPVVGNDGRVYAAKDAKDLSTGLVKDPITTLINGQPALVAERGPEMVIGRETTAAMMMARPDLLAEIVKFDKLRSGRTYKAYDEGNVDTFNVNAAFLSSADIEQLRATMSVLSSVLSTLQKNGISAHINKYGRGGVAQASEDGRAFMKRNSGSRLWS